MSMSKQDFVELAKCVRQAKGKPYQEFSTAQLQILADFCASQNPNFMRSRWFDYINGECGPNGGSVKKTLVRGGASETG